MSAGCWPFVSHQCPSCMYFLGYQPERLDDAGYRLPGWCRHRRVMMELFISEERPELGDEECAMYIPARRSSGAGSGLKPVG